MAKANEDITNLLAQAEQGDARAANELLALVYDELRRIAGSLFALERRKNHHTLQPTAVVHEAFLKLIRPEGPAWQNRDHFFAAAAIAMRRVLFDYARQHNAQKRGGLAAKVHRDIHTIAGKKPEIDVVDVIALEEALVTFEQIEAVGAKVVQLKFYCGLEMQEIADMLGLSLRKVEKHWTFAKRWFKREMSRT